VERIMGDFVAIAVIIASFALFAAYVVFCDRI
jgi:hypothetical protein